MNPLRELLLSFQAPIDHLQLPTSFRLAAARFQTPLLPLYCGPLHSLRCHPLESPLPLQFLVSLPDPTILRLSIW
jgi:hypothetical protein